MGAMTRLGRFLCNTMGWHKKPYEVIDFDGVNTKSRCPRCGMVGLVDSQGNLFSIR